MWAFRAFLDKDLEEIGLREDASGAVIHEASGLEFAHPGFMDALRRLAGRAIALEK